MNVLHPDNKIAYKQDDSVEVRFAHMDGQIFQGKIMGRATSENLIDYWIVMFPPDTFTPTYPYHCVSVPHVDIRLSGDNRPFLNEGVSRI